MKGSRTSAMTHRGGFTLPETAMAVGIVALVALPVLALLASGGSMDSVSRDRQAAAAIAEELAHSLRRDDQNHLALHANGSGWITLSPGVPVFLLLDEEGAIIRPISGGEHRDGLPGESAAGYLVEIRLSESPTGVTGSPVPVLRELDLIVEQPAAAPAASRSRDRFQSRVFAE